MVAEPTSGDVGETVLVSRNVPIGGEKAAPAILKAKDDAKEIQIENEVGIALRTPPPYLLQVLFMCHRAPIQMQCCRSQYKYCAAVAPFKALLLIALTIHLTFSLVPTG